MKFTSNVLKLYHESKIPLRVIKVLSSLYLQGTSEVHYRNEKSRQFPISQGVRQGSILAPYLYNIYFNLLLKEMESECSFGASCHGYFSGIIMYADDIILKNYKRSL